MSESAAEVRDDIPPHPRPDPRFPKRERDAATGWRFYVKDFAGVVCATRNRGRQVAVNLGRLAAERPGMIEVSFEGVEVATAPFMDEVVRQVRKLEDRAIYSCLSEDVHATLTYVENREAPRG